MSSKFEIDQWQAACTAFDNKDYDLSLKTFIGIADNAKMYFNIGLIFATVEDHDHALGAYSKAISMDPYFAVAYFQRGVSNFIKNDMESARKDFDEAYQKLRGNQIINYQQLGLSFRLYSCEVLFNRGVCQLYLGKIDAGLTDLYHAQKAKMTEEHDVIDQAVKDRGKGYSVFSIPPFVIFRPPESKLKQFNGVDIFAVVNEFNQKKPSQIKRNNSILLNEKLRCYKQPIPIQSTSTQKRKDSNLGMYYSDDSASTLSYGSYRYHRQENGRHVDSGFESALEDRYSSSSLLGRNSTYYKHQTKGQLHYSSSPISRIPKLHEDLDHYYYGDFDQDLDEVYGSLHTVSVQDKEKDRIRSRLVANKDDIHIQSSTSTSTIGSNNSSSTNKIKIKAHYTDTRILLVSNSIHFDELKSKIREKFGAPTSIRLQYKDEDNEMVLMIDNDDLYMARQVSKSRHGMNDLEKLEIWCVDSL
ncbi:uncharacterized protein BX663DRAFT_553685 [Cokeromyces recurvatus]|uniref:uncharacterized protein n=1 Tax=Cokeromyces recurvatus TaxID=90255 RepID=UPI00221FE705|nr:uncharacterized protein BX663DRAFT_553685 [Cokeromyces recurvatus]KAI7901056.1 hypothetical protein BX663DRAFT_553685 [Cokeromyces recurvatus]